MTKTNTDPRATAPSCFTDICRNAACSTMVAAHGDRWIITMGHAGFNSPANNRDGYSTEDAARASVLRYLGKTVAR